MINLTDNLVFVKSKNLKKEFLKSLQDISIKILNHYEKEIPENINKINLNLTFPFYFCNKNFNSLSITQKEIQDLFEYCMEVNSDNYLKKYNFIESNILLEKPHLKSGMKFVFLDLWLKGFILLPLHFNLKVNGLNNNFIESFETKFMKQIKEIDTDSEYIKNKYPTAILKIIRASNYKSFKDIDLLELNKLHIYIMKCKRGDIISKCPNINFFIEHFLKEIKEQNSDLIYDAFEYKSWLRGFFTRYKEINYIEYLEEKDDLYEYRLGYIKEQGIERKNKRSKNKKNEKPLNLNTLETEFLEISKKYSWTNESPVYLGYDFNIEKDSKIWKNLFNQYIQHRKDNGFETFKTQSRAFNFLMNYIFFYLNLWNSKNKEKVNIPTSPKDFHRTLYFTNKSITDKPKYFTIVDFLNIKTESASIKNSFIREIEAFFSFIIDFYYEEESIWNKALFNPIKRNDYYREYKNKKTNKVIIPKDIYGKLKKYLYSLEFFGEYLIEKSLKENKKISNSSETNIKPEEYGITPVFFHNNKVYQIKEVPNCYFYRRRTFNINSILNKNKEESIVTKRIPSVTVIRAFILMLNTGLRGAQVNWLDRDTWNKYIDKNKEQVYYKINVNTDKVKDNEWTSYISNGVYKTLLKETDYQNSMKEDFINKPVTYQNREYTRFDDIIPLFRSHNKSGLPVDFRKYWTDILWCFQNLINEEEKQNYQLIKLEKGDNINLVKKGGNHYCKLNIKAVHTPHSMRATFCTHMAEYLERSEIAALVGHESDLITSEVYIKPEESTIIDKMNKASDIFENGVNSDYFDKESKAHIKPNKEGSSLQKAFNQNREQTIELFNITSISMNINKDSEEQSKKAIDLLKNARMDHVIFETTHICPVGGICPQEVMSVIGEKRRCGLCPLALKCVDNLNPIYAKQRDLMREIKEGKESLEKAIKNKESEISINNIEDKVNLDIRELVSWKFSADILSQHYEDIKKNEDLDKKYYVEMPDMVKQHLQKVSVSNEKEYLLTRIADANAYSELNNNDNKYQAEMIRRNVVKNLNLIELEDYYVSEDEKVEVFCAMIKNMLDTNGIDLKELVNYDCFKSIEDKREKKKLLFKDIKLLK